MDDHSYVGGEVPAVRVAPRRQREQVPDVQHPPPRQRTRLQQLLRPVVVSDAVDDRHVRAGQHAGVLRAGLVAVRVGGRVDDDALHARLLARELRGEASPEVLRRDHVQPARSRACSRSRARTIAAGEDEQASEQRQRPRRTAQEPTEIGGPCGGSEWEGHRLAAQPNKEMRTRLIRDRVFFLGAMLARRGTPPSTSNSASRWTLRGAGHAASSGRGRCAAGGGSLLR